MQKTIAIGIVTLIVLSLLSTPAFAWVHNDGSEDSLFERYGPRAGKLLIHLYANDVTEFAALQAGDIDITDWPLPKTTYDLFVADPNIQVANYGPEYGLFLIDLNSQDNQYLGSPPDSAYPNPVADRDDATGNALIKGGDGIANNRNPMSDVWLRRAIGHLIDRAGYIAHPTIGAGFGFPMYTTMPPGMPKYLLDVEGDMTMPWAWDYDPAAAAAMLDANGFPVNGGTGFRFWDRNSDGIEQADEYVELIFYVRNDHPGRNNIGTQLIVELANVDLRYNVQFASSGTCFINVMVNKDFHMYTGGWNLGVDPDHLILWSYDYYWHPGFCYNYGGHNDPTFNAAAEDIQYPNNQAEAVAASYAAQEAQARNCLGIPVYCVSGNKAFRKTNVGGNPDPTEGQAWDNSYVNTLGYGIDNGWTMMNMHTAATEEHEDMTIDWGFKVDDIKQLNPIYASWLYDWNVLGLCYDSLLSRNASDMGAFMPMLAEDYEIGTYAHPVYGTCTKVRFTLRPDVKFGDGVYMTTSDVYFTFVELKNILEAGGYPNPWWYSNVENILSFSILDAYNFEVLLDVKSFWALGWIGGQLVLPKHIWKPIAEAGDPQAFQPDPDLVSTGPWVFDNFDEIGGTILLTRKGFKEYWRRAVRTAHKVKDVALGTITSAKKIAKKAWNKIIDITNEIRRYAVNVTIVVKKNGAIVHSQTVKVNPGVTIRKEFNIDPGTSYGKWEIEISITVGPDPGTKYLYWVTIPEDIAGSTFYDDMGDGNQTHPYKIQLPTPDFKVDIKDVALAAKGFGSYPGHERWQAVADLNGDYKIDIKDIAAIAKQFGWIG